jgi:hypothetical protein
MVKAIAAGVARDRLSMKLANRARNAASDSASRPPCACNAFVTPSTPGMALANMEMSPACTFPAVPAVVACMERAIELAAAASVYDAVAATYA